MSSDYTIGQYALPVPSEQLVATDNSTITGNGSGQAPLTAKAGEIPVVADGVTITGSGTNESPLATIPDKTPVLADGVTVLGNGTSVPLSAPGAGTSVIVDQVTIVGAGTVMSPYHVAPASLDGLVAVDTDATLTGNGTASSHLSVVSAPAGSTAVAVDGTSITGNGQTGTPLHTVAGGTASAVDGTTIGGTGVTGTPLHVIPGGLVGLVSVDADNVTTAGNGLSATPITQTPPYVDLRKAPYGVVANSTAAAAANATAISQAILDFSGTYARLVLPEGIVYVDAVNNSNHASIYFPNTVSQLTLAGQGMQGTSIQRFGAGGASSAEIQIDGATAIELCDFGILQSQITTPDAGQLNHLLVLINGATHVNCHDLFFGKSIGDQIRIAGGTGTIQNAQFSNLLMQGNGVVASTPANGRTGSRSGFAFETGFDRIEIGDFYAIGAEGSIINFETVGAGTMQYVNIHDGIADNSLSATPSAAVLGGNTGNLASFITMARVDVINGGISISNANNCVLDGDRVIISGAVPGDPTAANIKARNACPALAMIDLYVLRTGGMAALLVDVQVTGGPVVIEDGEFLQGTTAGAISVVDSPSVHIDGPLITYTGGSPAAIDAVTVQSLAASINECAIDRVGLTSTGGKFHATVSLYQRAAHVLKPARVTNIQSAGFSSCGVFMSVQTVADFDATPFISGIQNGTDAAWAQTDQTLTPITTLFPCIAGNPGDVASFVSQETPLNNLVAIQGCQCTFKNGDTTALFFKQTATDATGWVAVTIP